MTKVTNIFVSYNIVTDKVVSNNMKTIVHDRKIACYLLVETCANLKYNCKITQTSFRAKYSGLVFMEMRGNFRAVFHPAGDRLDTRRGCAPSLPKMAHIPGKDGVHPRPTPKRPFPEVVNAGGEHRAMQSKYLTACVAIWLMMKLTLRLYGSLRYVFPFLFGFVETDVYIYGRNDKQRQTKMKGYG